LKYAPFIGIAAALLLILFCFIPWAYYPDIRENFNGFYSYQNNYGKPGKTFIFLCVLSIVFSLVRRLWAKRVNQFLSVLIFAYALKTYILFSSSYNTYSPDIKPGLYGIVFFSFIILASSLFSKSPLKTEEEA
jgi:hypothetical protein